MNKLSIDEQIAKGERLLKGLSELREKGVFTFSESVRIRFNIHNQLLLLKNMKRAQGVDNK